MRALPFVSITDAGPCAFCARSREPNEVMLRFRSAWLCWDCACDVSVAVRDVEVECRAREIASMAKGGR